MDETTREELEHWVAETRFVVDRCRAMRTAYLALPERERRAYAASKGFSNLTEITARLVQAKQNLARYEQALQRRDLDEHRRGGEHPLNEALS